MSGTPRSVAEVASMLAMPLGLAQVLIADAAEGGAITVHPPVPNQRKSDPGSRV